MTNIDQFESVFKAADKTPFRHERIEIKSVLVVTDLDVGASAQFAQQAQSFLKVLQSDAAPTWQTVTGDRFSHVGQLLQRVGEQDPDLICTYRNLHTPATEYPYSLGVFIDVLTQASTIPVLLLPHPLRELTNPDVLDGTQTVMAITDHLTGDHHLVSVAASLVAPSGKLLLTHVEDEHTFDRYVQTIGKIPSIDTDPAAEAIRQQLLKEPRDYIESCSKVLRAEGETFTVEAIVEMGHRLADYKRLVESHNVNLLVLNTKDEDQLAMHGLAYPLSVELRETPMLLL